MMTRKHHAAWQHAAKTSAAAREPHFPGEGLILAVLRCVYYDTLGETMQPQIRATFVRS